MSLTWDYFHYGQNKMDYNEDIDISEEGVAYYLSWQKSFDWKNDCCLCHVSNFYYVSCMLQLEMGTVYLKNTVVTTRQITKNINIIILLFIRKIAIYKKKLEVHSKVENGHLINCFLNVS